MDIKTGTHNISTGPELLYPPSVLNLGVGSSGLGLLLLILGKGHLGGLLRLLLDLLDVRGL